MSESARRKGRIRQARWLTGAAGVGAVASLAGVTVARSLMRRISDDDPYRDEDFELLEADRGFVVTSEDGVPLAVREVGPEDAALTVVFAHGFCLRMDAFHFQRARLTEQWGDQVRMVFYDHRGHGRSGDAHPDTFTVDQLGRDLEAVLAVMAPRGPVVLVGHSMGGMTVLSHARQFAGAYPTRIVGAALIASAAEGVARSPVGEILKNPVLEGVRVATRYAPKTLHRTRGAARAVIGPVLRAGSYGGDKVSPSVVTFSERMMHDTSITTLVGFLHALEVHDESAGLKALRKIPTMIACGERDLITPKDCSERMAAELPNSELVIIGGAGHLVQLEQPEIVNDALVRLVERATPSKLTALTRRLKQRMRPHG